VSVPLEIPLIQVAGICDRAESMLLQECGIRYIGFPLRLPMNRADLTEPEAADIIRWLRPRARGVLITYLDRRLPGSRHARGQQDRSDRQRLADSNRRTGAYGDRGRLTGRRSPVRPSGVG
jgi:hypothetical protein